MSELSRIPIGRFSIITQLTPKALRLYDKKGLLVPEEKDTLTGYRYYTMPQLETGIKIKLLTWLGFSLEEIGDLLEASESENKTVLDNLFNERLEETEKEIERLTQVRKILRNKEESLKLFYLRTTQPSIKEVPDIRVISLRQIAPIQQIGPMIGKIMQEIYRPENQRNMVSITGPIMFLHHGEEFTPENADFEVAVPITGRVTLEAKDLQVRTIPKSKVASTTYRGPYPEIGQGYVRVHEFVIENNYEISGPLTELYLNSPQEVPPEQLLTEIQLPIIQEDTY
ncbi:MAG: Transcriptional regulator, MerR family [Candidatus Thorarchaeota archaeon]|nr:MAG: Transcriptional regulator, MerR family [Candidatus Thorarchaeota archaeon]